MFGNFLILGRFAIGVLRWRSHHHPAEDLLGSWSRRGIGLFDDWWTNWNARSIHEPRGGGDFSCGK